ncbi:magnesium transporter [Rhodopirellula sp. JC740]|uniref:Magnesium transporter MgtE n=1 Tax=Rhodopirellula halodulae TaxID=2894198 RepID=A0ABS8NJJ0_9BACT|nr:MULTISPECIES: magnesium transporter [unclassified Rhodopirellula]MCC9643102.1 magnesium transporter [Rhodopirellula sp. JC740]MCC9655240.1 magnesium transporter [Rhodopirellula sp. JC737]
MVNTLFLPELREMLQLGQESELREFCVTLNAGRTAEFMEGLHDAEVWAVLQYAEPERRAEIFGYFEEPRQLHMLAREPAGQAAELVEYIPPDDRVDLIQNLPEEAVEKILPLLPAIDRRDIERLRSYDEGTAGSLMTTDVAKLAERFTAREALEELGRRASDLETIYYLYVVDDNNLLRGIVSARQLVSAISNTTKTLGDLMETDVVVALVGEDQESVAEKVERFNLLAIPVVDSGRQLLGIITHDDVIDVVREELTEDAQRIAAVAPLEDEFLRIGLFTLSYKRGIWLTILFFAALLTAFALRAYETELELYAWLVWFIPLIISAGGNSGSQSATLVITAMTSGEVKNRDLPRVLSRELVVSLLLGLFLAFIGFAVALFIAPSPWDAMVIPFTLLSVIVCGCMCGVALPIMFKRMGLDPALMSNPFVAGIVDILGIVIYINVARVLLAD